MVKKHLNPTKIDFIKCIVEDCLWQIRDTKNVDVPDLVEAWSIDVRPRESKSVIPFVRGIQDNDPVSFLHVKRIKKLDNDTLRVLIGSKEYIPDRSTFDNMLKGVIFQYDNVKDDNKVPKVGPSTKSLMLKWSEQYWPLIWRGNPNDQILNDYIFDMTEIRSLLTKIAEESRAIRDLNTMQLPIVSAFVNPNSGKIIISKDYRHSGSPLDHSIMVGINQVAKQEQERRDRVQNGTASEEDIHQGETYLCLDFDVYTSHEPCSMCSMALIHSRVKRCIFINPMSVSGALKPDSGDGYCMHSNKDLNSKYEVFQWVGEELEVPGIDSTVCS
ncbi:Tad3 [Kluyveromyces lactis]|nr:Tad3 [Kluyveromyces lactis]